MLSAGLHTLATHEDTNSSKHCILVKLTDSGSKFIQEYLKFKVRINDNDLNCFKNKYVEKVVILFNSKDNLHKKPTILFQKDKGVSFFYKFHNTALTII